MSRNNLITIGEILELSPGDRQNATWINDDFEAVVSDVKRGNGKAPSTAVLTDPHNNGIAIVGNFFGSDPSRFAGKVCHFSGKGITRTEYKGVQQITMGDKATVQVVGDAPKNGSSNGATNGSSSNGHANGNGNGHANGSSAAHTAGVMIEGPTVGMAINQACECIRQSNDAVGPYFTSPQFSKDLWTIASDIVRIARVMQSGKLADSPKHRADPEAAKREEEERKAKEEAERKAREEQERKKATAATGNVDEDVPF